MTPSLTSRRTPWIARRRGLGAFVVLAALAMSTSAGAESRGDSRRQKARTEFDKAQIQYKLGHFEDALEAYSRAYELFPAPAFLFNVGQCHKNLKNHERAIFFFEGYLREETNPTKRALAEELVAESRIELERQIAGSLATKPSAAAALAPAATDPSDAAQTPRDAGMEAPPVFTVALAPPAPLGAAIVVPAAGPAATVDADDERSGRLTHAWWFWTAIGAGVLALGGGLIYLGSGGTTRVLPEGSVGTLDRR